MNPAAIVALIGPAMELVRYIVGQAQLLKDKGEMTPEQFAEVKQRAAISDANWDSIVAAARARIAGGG